MKKSLISQEEKVPANTLAKEIRRYLSRLRLEKKKRFTITHNEKPEAVLLSLKYYEELMGLISELKGHLRTSSNSKNILDRVSNEKNLENAITLKELGTQHGFEK